MSRRAEILQYAAPLEPKNESQQSPDEGDEHRSKHRILPQLRQLPGNKKLLWIVVACAVAVLVFGVLLLPNSQGKKMKVPVASTSIAAGTPLVDKVDWVTIPTKFIPENADLTSTDIHDARAAGALDKGEIITRSRVNPLVVPDGWRAVSIHSATGAAALPGTHTEIVGTPHRSHTPPLVICQDAIIQQHVADTTDRVVLAMPQSCAYKLAQLPEDHTVSLLLR